jgi:hypothetical protein
MAACVVLVVLVTVGPASRGTAAATQQVAPASGEAVLDLGSARACIPPPEARLCDAMRLGLWNGDPAVWATRGVTDPDAVFNETVVFRVRAGDPTAVSAIARLIGAPYVKITRVHFQQPDFVEITNLGGAAQNIFGWSLHASNFSITFAPPEIDAADAHLEPGQRCTVYTGPKRDAPGERCLVYFLPESRPPPDWLPDDGGELSLFADPLGLLADETRYDADPDNQPPPPNLQLPETLEP